MADSIMHFLIQWEDQYLSVIERKHILHPVKGELEYYEGELITALFGKQKTYEAVICEIHPNKKYLQGQAKLPPKKTYDEAKKCQESGSSSQPAVSPGDRAGSSGISSSRITESSSRPAVSPGDRAGSSGISSSHITESSSRPAVSPGDRAGSSGLSSSITESSSQRITESSSQHTLLPRLNAGSADAPSDQRANDQHSSAFNFKPTVGLPVTVLKWEGEYRRMRKKMRKLEERVTSLESSMDKYNPETSTEDENTLDIVSHLTADSVSEIVSVLAKSVFSVEEIINCSRTGKKTVKCTSQRRPALDSAKLLRLERLVMKKTGIKKEVFVKKFENLQKVLRRK